MIDGELNVQQTLLAYQWQFMVKGLIGLILPLKGVKCTFSTSARNYRLGRYLSDGKFMKQVTQDKDNWKLRTRDNKTRYVISNY